MSQTFILNCSKRNNEADMVSWNIFHLGSYTLYVYVIIRNPGDPISNSLSAHANVTEKKEIQSCEGDFGRKEREKLKEEMHSTAFSASACAMPGLSGIR